MGQITDYNFFSLYNEKALIYFLSFEKVGTFDFIAFDQKYGKQNRINTFFSRIILFIIALFKKICDT